MKDYLRLEDLEVYELAMSIGKEVWDIVLRWDYFQKDTVGKQIVRSADSISANISEGYGRFTYKENRQFCIYARGSLMETKTWITKSHQRNLITEVQYNHIIENLKKLHLKLNAYIKSINKKISNN